MANQNEFEFEFRFSTDRKSCWPIEYGRIHDVWGRYYERSVHEVTIPSEYNGVPVEIDADRVAQWSEGISALLVEVDNPFYKSIDGVIYTKDGKTLVAYPKGKKESFFRIPQGVTTIGKAAFRCASIGVVEIPNTVVDLGDRAFEDCDALEKIVVDEKNPKFISENGVLFSKDKKQLIKYPEGKSGKFYRIDDSIENICKYCFGLRNDNLRNLFVGRGIKTLGECSIVNFERVYIPETFEGAELEQDYKFDENGNRCYYDFETEIFDFDWFDDGPCYYVEVVGGKGGSAIEAYCNERNIPFVILGDDEIDEFFTTPIEELKERAIKQYENETEFVVRDEKAGWRARFENGTLEFSTLNGHAYIEKTSRLICEPRRAKVKKIIIGDGIQKLAYGAFDEKYENLESVHIGKDVCEIDTHAFKVTFYPYFNNLSGITVDEDNKWFRSVDGVLYTHDLKTLLKYPQGKKEFYFEVNANVGDYAFEYAQHLLCVKFGKGCHSMGKEAFYEVRQYLQVWFDRSVTKWKEYPFQVLAKRGIAYRCDDLVIGGYKDSYVHKFCKDEGVYFLPIEDEEEIRKFMAWPIPEEESFDAELKEAGIFANREPYYAKNPYYMECKKQMIINCDGHIMQIGEFGDELILPEGAKSARSIDLCDAKRLVIPKTMEFLYTCFHNPAPNLQEIVVAEGNEHLKTVNGHLCTTNGEFLTYLPTTDNVGIIPDGIVKISPYAFNLIEKPIEKLYLPASLKEWNFNGCYRQNYKCFYDLEVNPRNTAFKAIDGNLFTADGKTLLYAKVSESSFTVPDGTEVIEAYSMVAVNEGAVVTIPVSVREIKNVWFWRRTIRTTAGSYAEKYAREHDINVELM